MRRESLESLRQMASRMRLSALNMALGAGRNGAHLGAALSSMEILAVLYGQVLRFDPSQPSWPDRDRFIASKGHCVLALYAALAEVGFISKEILATFGKKDSCLAGHPCMDMNLGLEYSSGSLGMGLGVSVGMAIDARQKGRTHRVFVLLGDGELNEGSNWEGFMAAGHFKLSNMVAVVDRNRFQLDGPTEDIMSLGDLPAKIRAFNWNVKELDGHDIGQLLTALDEKNEDRPLAVIANTIKGKGISFMENAKEWHHASLSQAQYDQAVKEISEAAAL